MDDGSVLEALYVLFGLVQTRLFLLLGRRSLHQLDEVVTVHFVHDAKHPPAVVTDPLQVLPFAGEGLSCRREERGGRSAIKVGGEINRERDKVHITHLIYRGAFEGKLVKITAMVLCFGLSVITSANPQSAGPHRSAALYQTICSLPAPRPQGHFPGAEMCVTD